MGKKQNNKKQNSRKVNDEIENKGKENDRKENDKKEVDKQEIDKKQAEADYINETGGISLEGNKQNHKIELITIIGEIEGHENLSGSSKTTKYEHLLPKLAQMEDAADIDGILILLNTMGGDVEAGLAIAEMIASISKPTVSLVLGGSHSIGVPIAVSADYSFIVESAAMVIHPVRMNGMVIGTPATFDYFKSIQDRITGFVTGHADIDKETFEKLMMETKVLTKDVGSVLVGDKTVEYGIINEVGGLKEAMAELHRRIDAAGKETGENVG